MMAAFGADAPPTLAPTISVNFPHAFDSSMRTVFHVSDPDALSTVVAKVENLYDDDALVVDTVSVVFDRGAVIDALVDDPDAAAALVAAGATPRVCSNALGGADADRESLPEGVRVVSSGVGELTRLQDAGYAYIRV